MRRWQGILWRGVFLLTCLLTLGFLHDYFFQRRRQFRYVSLLIFFGLGGSLPTSTLVPINALSNVSSTSRVLAVINGGWSEAQYATPQRMALLHDQLLRYVYACEEGYDVHVLLLTYEGWRADESVDMSRYFCSRRASSFRVTVQLFPMEPLPPGTHGTLGTLAFQHRAIFQRDVHLYDLFLVQEDDVAVLPSHLDYFLRWTAVFKGTEFYPGLLFYELAPWLVPTLGDGSAVLPGNNVSDKHAFLDWRLNDAYLLRGPADHQLLSLWSSSCCAYMLTQAQLMRAVAQPSWMGALHTFSGEFNPYFGSARWMHRDYKVVVPAGDLRRAMLWHEPNKYILSEWRAAGTDTASAKRLGRITLAEAEAVLAPCCRDCVAHSNADSREALHAIGEDCSQCQDAVAFNIVPKLGQVEPLKVAYECVRALDVMFPPPED